MLVLKWRVHGDFWSITSTNGDVLITKLTKEKSLKLIETLNYTQGQIGNYFI
jgi:hypothetical protein